jgi:hypothetical protein
MRALLIKMAFLPVEPGSDPNDNMMRDEASPLIWTEARRRWVYFGRDAQEGRLRGSVMADLLMCCPSGKVALTLCSARTILSPV